MSIPAAVVGALNMAFVLLARPLLHLRLTLEVSSGSAGRLAPA